MNTLSFALILIGCLVALMLLSRISSSLLGRTVGGGKLYYLILAPGTIIHESFHALACLVTVTRIYEIHLFRPKRMPDGTLRLGEVVHKKVGTIRTFLIGVAPLLGGSVAIYLLSAWLLPTNIAWSVMLRSGWTYLFLGLTFLVGLGLAPSRQDLRAVPGFLIVVAVLGGAGYLFARLILNNNELSSAAKTVSSALQAADRGLVFVVVVVAALVVIQRVLLFFHRGV